MPFKSQAQRRWMHANEPEMAKRWEKETPKGKKLPEKKAKADGKRKCKVCGAMVKDMAGHMKRMHGK